VVRVVSGIPSQGVSVVIGVSMNARVVASYSRVTPAFPRGGSTRPDFQRSSVIRIHPIPAMRMS
jgi:hypothetical protein